MVSPQLTPAAAFQFYPRDWLASDKVSRMTLAEQGMYFTLLCHAWLAKGLPNDLTEIAKYLRMGRRQLEKHWRGPLGECFVLRGGRFVNPRQERIRKDLDDYRRKQADNGMRGGRPKKAVASSGITQPITQPEPKKNSASASASAKEEKNTERARAGAPIHTSHKSHAACGRICVPAFLHTEFVGRRNHLQADKELRDFYGEIEGVWSTGAHEHDEPGDPVVFWRARYDEKWPAHKPAAGGRYAGWQPR